MQSDRRTVSIHSKSSLLSSRFNCKSVVCCRADLFQSTSCTFSRSRGAVRSPQENHVERPIHPHLLWNDLHQVSFNLHSILASGKPEDSRQPRYMSIHNNPAGDPIQFLKNYVCCFPADPGHCSELCESARNNPPMHVNE